jgi:hypothetical protein
VSPPWLSFNRRLIALLVLLTLSYLLIGASEEQTGDSLAYAYSIETGDDLFHPHHILFAPVTRVLYLGAQQLFPSVDAITVAQVRNTLWATVAVTVLFIIVWLLTASQALALMAALFLLVSNGLIVYATQAEVYVAASGCLSLVALILLRGTQQGWTIRGLVLLALFFALSVLYHQTNVLAVLPIAFAVVATGQRGGLQRLIMVLGLSGIGVLAFYLVAFAGSGEPLEIGRFITFCLSYTYHPNPAWGTVSHFSPQGVALLLKSQLRNIVYLPPGTSGVVVPAIACFGLLLAGTCACMIRQAIRMRLHRAFRLFLLLWLAVMYLFFLWWLPGEDEFFITTLIPLLIITFWSAHEMFISVRVSLRKYLIPTATVMLLGTLAVNLSYATFPRARSRGDHYREAARIDSLAGRDCTIVCGYDVMQHLRYYFRRTQAIEAELVLLFAYHHGMIPDSFKLPGENCVLVPLAVTGPDYGGVGVDGYRNRRGWQLFFEWLFDISKDPKSANLTARHFELCQPEAGPHYLKLLPERIEYANRKALFEELDRRTAGLDTSETRRFMRWLEAGGWSPAVRGSYARNSRKSFLNAK